MDSKEEYTFNLFGEIYKVQKPSRTEILKQDRQQFSEANEVLKLYRGMPQQLQAAFERFIAIESLGLFYAGLASFLVVYSYKSRNEYYERGIKAAEKWLQKALAIAPNEEGVLLASFDCYLAQKEYALCKETIHRGLELYPNSFEVRNQNITFLIHQGTVRQLERALKEMHKLKLTKSQKYDLYAQEAYGYLAKRAWKKAEKSYKRVIKMKPNDPWAWHNLSIAQYQAKNGFTSFYSNRRALALMDFGAARDMERKIRPLFIMQTGAVIAGVLIVFSPLYL